MGLITWIKLFDKILDITITEAIFFQWHFVVDIGLSRYSIKFYKELSSLNTATVTIEKLGIF